MYIHTYIHTYVYTYVHTPTHPPTHPHPHPHPHPTTHTPTHAYNRARHELMHRVNDMQETEASVASQAQARSGGQAALVEDTSDDEPLQQGALVAASTSV